MSHSNSEVGIEKNIANSKTIYSFAAGHGAAYTPSKPALQLPAYQTLITSVQNAAKLAGDAAKPFITSTATRGAAFEPLKKLATKVLNAIKITDGVTPGIIRDASATNRKIQGATAHPPKKDGGDTGAGGEDDAYSTSQRSFINQVGFLNEQIALIENIPNYAPNEIELQILSLQALANHLGQLNDQVTDAYTPWSNARIARNKLMNTDETGLVDVSLDIKKYFKSKFGATSPEYHQISALKFVKTDD